MIGRSSLIETLSTAAVGCVCGAARIRWLQIIVVVMAGGVLRTFRFHLICLIK